MGATPRAALEKYGQHSRLRSGQHVVVEAIADVSDLGSRPATSIAF
jgi:hypothetical protein